MATSTMVKKYSRHLEQRDINDMTGEIWKIDDVPRTWNKPTKEKVIADGYYFAEDGTAWPRVNEE